MLTQLHLKNWRSLRDVTIDFAPITVFIGANSSGKTNLVSALEFLHDLPNLDADSVVQHLKRLAVFPIGGGGTHTVEINLVYHPTLLKPIWDFGIEIDQAEEKIATSGGNRGVPFEFNGLFPHPFNLQSVMPRNYSVEETEFINYLIFRWQLLAENFQPKVMLSVEEKHSDFQLTPDARNTVRILEFMRQRYPEIYQQLQDELQWLLSHIENLEPISDELKTRLSIREHAFTAEAPTISAGTARMVAMLTAIHALDMRQPDLPGLVIIEEPDTALNPGLLARFVELVRGYAENRERPRQFIFTTHNPTFLNLFKPEEVRVVSRDRQGVTTVNPIPDYIEKIWLEEGEYQLGDVWQTNAFGGLAE